MKTQLQQQRQKSLTLRTCRTRTAFRKQRCECRLSSDKNKLNIKKKSRRDVLLIRGSFCSSRLPETEMEDVTKRLTMWLKHVKSNLQFLNNVWNTDSTTGRALGAFDWSTSENTTQSYLMSLRCFQSVKHIYKLNSNSDLVTFSHKKHCLYCITVGREAAAEHILLRVGAIKEFRGVTGPPPRWTCLKRLTCRRHLSQMLPWLDVEEQHPRFRAQWELPLCNKIEWHSEEARSQETAETCD